MSESRKSVVQRKIACDDELQRLKAVHSEARRAAAAKGVFMNPVQFANLEAKIRQKKTQSQQLQMLIGETPKEKPEKSINDYFRDAAGVNT